MLVLSGTVWSHPKKRGAHVAASHRSVVVTVEVVLEKTDDVVESVDVLETVDVALDEVVVCEIDAVELDELVCELLVADILVGEESVPVCTSVVSDMV
jgi:hypothetical protein